MKLFNWLFKKKQIDLNNIPQHIAIIMDGNGRWAKKRGLPRSFGHKAGAQTLEKIIESCQKIGIKYLTVYAFSTENWGRPKDEVDYLMNLLSEYIQRFRDDKRNKDIKVKVIGDLEGLQDKIKQDIIKTEDFTKDNKGIQLNIAINYGGRDEICFAVKNIIKEIDKGILKVSEINGDIISKNLYTSGIPDPDLIIRPSGELRLSNFLLYQCAYSEFWFSKINWPDFNEKYLFEAICDYQNRNRRFGGI